MAKARQKRAVVDKWKKKKKFSIIGPKAVGNVELGETISEKPELVVGRTIKANMGQLTNQARKKNVDLTFKVREVQGSNANTELVGYEVKSSFLRRLFRRKSSKIETVQYLRTKDRRRVKIKAVVVTQRKVEIKKQKDIRKMVMTNINSLTRRNSFESFMVHILEKDVFYHIVKDMKKIAPIKRTEIQLVKLLDQK